jgi:2-keto-3-deoxy-L-rhamnonate aldolase RhmA
LGSNPFFGAVTEIDAGRDRRGRPDRQLRLGLFVAVPHPVIVEVAGIIGLDFIVIDDEQVRADPSVVYAMTLAAKAHGLRALVRLGAARADEIVAYLGMGVDGVLLPGLDGVPSVKSAAAAVQYPPSGQRSMGGNVGNRFALGSTWPAVIADANEAAETHVIVETVGMLEEIEDVAALEEVSSLDIGLLDLSAALGCPGQLSSSVVLDAVGRVARAGEANGKAVVCAASTTTAAERFLDMGVTALLLDPVRLIHDGASRFFDLLARRVDGEAAR